MKRSVLRWMTVLAIVLAAVVCGAAAADEQHGTDGNITWSQWAEDNGYLPVEEP
ncbi:MAG: hypothetical protein IKS31_11780 [Clostridia bacterium]|nr:hypothetical protein [Clostridia bacterium]